VKLLANAHKKAEALDEVLSSRINTTKIETAKKLFYRLQSYLVEQCRNHAASNNIYSKIKFYAADSKGVALILLGPSIDKGPSEEHINLDSGSRLSFLVAVKEGPSGSELVTFRFHLQFSNGHSPAYLRFDLNSSGHTVPLGEPRCHFHPGLEDVRIPLPILHPVEILDRIFFVIEPTLGKRNP